MGRLIVLILLVVLAVWLIRRALRASQPKERPPVQGDLVACARCGVHLPRSEGLVTRGLYYCSAEHQRQHTQSD